jgi:hypothetical protein
MNKSNHLRYFSDLIQPIRLKHDGRIVITATKTPDDYGLTYGAYVCVKSYGDWYCRFSVKESDGLSKRATCACYEEKNKKAVEAWAIAQEEKLALLNDLPMNKEDKPSRKRL